MERRVFLAILLSFVVLIVYQSQFAPAPPPPATVPATSATPAPSPSAALATPAPSPAVAPAAPAAKPLVGDAAARDILVETDSATAIFNTRGGVMTSFRLRHYANASGEPLELIPSGLPEGAHARPFTVATDSQSESATLASALYQPSASQLSLGSGSGALTFEYRDDSGLRATKTITIQQNGQPYVFKVDASVDVGGTPRPVTIAFGPAIGLGYNPAGSSFLAPRAIQSLDGSVKRHEASAIQSQPRYEGVLRFAGVEEHYFLAVALPASAESRVDYSPVVDRIPGDETGATRSLMTFAVRPKPAPTPAATTTMIFFVGPKDFDHLRATDPQLVYAIDFGMFSVIVVPMLQALKWLNRYLGNYGWSIIALTVLINIIIFPLRHRSMVSMRKMQALQPEMKAIQERYKKFKATDPEKQKMNQELMALYKQKGVNPASGCVPMLLTMPILLAFYNLLGQAIELRGAPFIGWIHDLSARDPTYIWPVLMGATMFWQQRMTPSTADPTQQKIFMFLPLVFTAMFLTMPSGLVIYWMVSNLLTIAQQYLTNHLIGGPPPRVAVPRKA